MGVPVLLMLYCGLRRGELLALLWSDIDFENSKLNVNKAANMPTNASSIKAPKTEAGNREIPIPAAIMPAVKEARRAATSLYVCPAVKTGGMMSAQAFSEAWKSYMHFLNLCAGGRDKVRTKNKDGQVQFIPGVQAMEPFTAHQLRHSYATMLYDANVDLKTAQKLCGHADIQTLMNIYTELSEEKEGLGTDALNSYLNSKLGERLTGVMKLKEV